MSVEEPVNVDGRFRPRRAVDLEVRVAPRGLVPCIGR